MRKQCLFLMAMAAWTAAEAALPERMDVASVPDSAYLFSYATTKNNNRNGLHFAWSLDRKVWHPVGPERSYLSCDYGRWGAEKRMLDPYLYRAADGLWHCLWDVNERDGVVAEAVSEDLVHWRPQSYQAGRSYPKERVAVTIRGAKAEGTLLRVSWPEVEALLQADRRATYEQQLNAEQMKDDPVRFASLKPFDATITVDAADKKAISDLLLGVFFEDISYAADGGLYAEMVQNRDFEYAPGDKEGKDPAWNPTHSWALQATGHAGAALSGSGFTIDSVAPIHPNNPHYGVVTVDAPGAVAFTNTGFDGFCIRKGEKYDFSLYNKVKAGKGGKLSVRLVAPDGTVVATSSVSASSRDWKQRKTVLTATADADSAALQIIPEAAATYAFDMVSLFPQSTFNGRKNGLRADLAQTIADLHPRFVRFPGGCVAHGDGLDNIYRWKNTIGPLEARVPQRNLWGYHQTAGLGYFEYFQFCEDLGAEPVPVIAAAVPCQNSATGGAGQQGGIPMEQMDAYIQDIFDLVEYANGDPASEWGRKRAEAGHPKPFGLKYIGIGNEDLISEVFVERFKLIYKAMKEKHPEITVIGTVGPWCEGSDYEAGWRLADTLQLPMVDEHYYQTPGWFINHQDYYDKYDRTKSKVYLGEYAAHLPGRPANLETALSEALYLTAVERNADVVSMASYAPLLAKEGHVSWSPDLIYFNNREVKPTVGYYVQQLYGTNAGNEYLSNRIDLPMADEKVDRRIACSVVRDGASGDLILKLANLLPVAVTAKVNLSNAGRLPAEATRTLLTGKPTDKQLQPVVDQVSVGEAFSYTLPAYSFSVIRIQPEE